MNFAPFAARRRALLDRIGDGIAIVPTAPERVRNRDTYHPYRADSYFWYLTGFPEPEAVLVLRGGNAPRTILFCRDKDLEREVWDGFRHGPEAAREAFGIDEAWPIAQLDEKLPELLSAHDAVWYALGEDAGWDRRIATALAALRAQVRAGRRAPSMLCDLRRPLDAMRRRKDAHEIACLRRAADITSAGHARAMRACRPGLAEYALEAELTHEFRAHGAAGHAYPPIVASGADACTLHYVDNAKALADGTLVLIDAGCEFDGYAADITRTFPVGGRFGAAERDVYEIVLAAQAAAIDALRPGASFAAFHEAALRVLTQGLVDLGVLHGSLDALLETEAYKPFYMHRTGHWLGLDVHDAGDYKDGAAWTTFAPGMVVTVEPGLYLRPGPGVPDALAWIGVRIEDDALITDSGCDIYTHAPKSVADIEETMRRD